MDNPSPPVRRVTVATVVAALGIIALVVPEIWLTAAALLWGVHVIAHLSLPADVALGAAIAVPTLWATWHVVRLAFECETNPENAAS